MNTHEIEIKEKARRDQAKKAVVLAIKSQWEEAVRVNCSILENFPQDFESYNRLGKAFSELGQNRKAKEAFKKALQISPHNSIAEKNLDRLTHLGDSKPQTSTRSSASPLPFIAESGKSGITSLINLAPPNILMKMTPGHPANLETQDGVLIIVGSSGENVGQVEPKLASRLVRLMKGGNQYEATVTSVNEQELTLIIRETYKSTSQADIVSFPSSNRINYPVYIPGTLLDTETGEGEKERIIVKDWSDDDTEPGDDDAFTPVFHRIIKAGDEEDLDDDEY